MSNQESNSKRIAKNTLLLYFRMILIMVVSLYTSRVILNELGVEDFGIYNLVAGVVVLFSFLSNAMVTATQRYLSVAIGKGDEKYIQSIFSTSLLSHFILILFIVFVAPSSAFISEPSISIFIKSIFSFLYKESNVLVKIKFSFSPWILTCAVEDNVS